MYPRYGNDDWLGWHLFVTWRKSSVRSIFEVYMYGKRKQVSVGKKKYVLIIIRSCMCVHIVHLGMQQATRPDRNERQLW